MEFFGLIEKAYKLTFFYSDRPYRSNVGISVDKKVVYAIVIAVLIFAIGTALQKFANNEGAKLILFFVGLFAAGFIVTGVKRGFLLGFILAIAFTIANMAILSPESFGALSDVNVALAFILLTLINALIAAVLAAVGGFLGKRILKKREKSASPAPA
jgi:MFS family permease